MLGPVRQVATLAAVVLLGAIVAKEVFARGRVGLNRIMGAIALYLLLGVGFCGRLRHHCCALHAP